jgi:lipid-binding SYLF domain-containing protein
VKSEHDTKKVMQGNIMKNCLIITIAIFLSLGSIIHAGDRDNASAISSISYQASSALIKQSEEIPTKRVSRDIRDNAKCILVFPQVIKRGLYQIDKGKSEGLVSCRLTNQSWSAPAYVELSATGAGLQESIKDATIIIYLLSDDAVFELLDPNIELGANLNFIAGPVGRSAKAKDQAAVISYVRTTKLFAGLDIEDPRVRFMTVKNNEAYGKSVTTTKILTELIKVPERFTAFMATLIGYAPLPLKEKCNE